MPPMTLRIDDSQLRRKIAAMDGPIDRITKEAAKQVGGVFANSVADLTHKDTNRLANGWIQAGRAAGVTDRPELPLVQSARREQFLKQLEEELEGFAKTIAKADGWMKKYERDDLTKGVRKDGTPRKKRTRQKFYKTQKRIKAKAQKRYDRVIEELEKALGSEHFIFFDRESFVQRRQGRAFSTVREKAYGGTGSLTKSASLWIVRFINREPHGTIVERHPHLGHPVATAKKLTEARISGEIGAFIKKQIRTKTPLGSSRAA